MYMYICIYIGLYKIRLFISSAWLISQVIMYNKSKKYKIK